MSSNQPLFESLFAEAQIDLKPLTGSERKYSGMETVLSTTPDEYKERFINVVKGLLKGYTFTVEDITGIVGRPPDGKSNAIGGLISACAKQGLVVFTGRMPEAKRPGMNATRLMEWRRL